MKKILFVLFLLPLSSAWGLPWGHRYVTEQLNQNITVDINTSFTVSVEWGEGGWTSSSFGYGSTTNGTNWTWVDLPWFQDGDGTNKRCKTNVSVTTPGKYYYAYRFIQGGTTSYSFGSADWAENLGTLSATSTITVGEFSIANGNWSETSIWNGGAVPIDTKNVGIYHSVTLNQTGNVKSINIISGGSLSMGSYTLTIASGGSLTNNGTFTAGTGTVAFAGTGTVTETVGFNHVTLAGGVNFGTGSTINGTLTINSGGFVSTNSPSYGSSSTLIYNTVGGSGAKFNQALEWPASSGPANVSLTNNTWVQLTSSRSLTGNLTVTNGALQSLGGNTLTMNGTTQAITISTTSGGAIYGTDNETGNNLTLLISSGSTTTLTGDATISNDNEKKFYNITVNSGGTLALSRGILCKYGSFSVSGTLQINSNGYVQATNGVAASYSSGKLIYNNGGPYTSTNYEWPTSNAPTDVTVQNSSSITLNGSKTLTGDLTITTGSLSIGINSLTVSGTLTNSAGYTGLVINSGGSLIQSSSGVDATVKRAFNAWSTDKGWHFVSSPVSSQSISGAFTVTPADEYDFYKWDEAANLWLNQKVGGNNITSFTPGVGYLAAYKTDEDKLFTGDNGSNSLNYQNINFEDLVISSGTNQGWHLLGNPFPCAITWGTGWSLTNINTTAKVWKESTAAYVDVASGGIIPALNGFMVQVTAGHSGDNSLTIPTAARIHDATPWYKSSDCPTLVLVANDPAGQTAQESVVKFTPEATPAFDPAFDSHYLSGYAPDFYSVAGTEQLSTNALPEISAGLKIPFYFIRNEGTEFTIEAQEITDISGPVVLIDLKTGISQDLTLNPVYGFTAAAGDAPDRFQIAFSPVGIGETGNNEPVSIYTSGKLVYISGASGNGTVTVYDLTGRQQMQSKLSNGTLTTLSLNALTGYYLVKVVTEKQTTTTKVFIR